MMFWILTHETTIRYGKECVYIFALHEIKREIEFPVNLVRTSFYNDLNTHSTSF